MMNFTLNRNLAMSVAMSAACMFTTNALAQDYAGTAYNGPHTLPSVIGGTTIVECEDYDGGGEGVGFHMGSANPDQKNLKAMQEYRTDGNYFTATKEADGQIYLSNFLASGGDWLNYTLDVKEGGYYTIITSASRDANATANFKFSVDGVDVKNVKFKGAAGGWKEFVDVEAVGIKIPAGTHVLKYEVVGGGRCNIDNFKIIYNGEHQYYNLINAANTTIQSYMYDELTDENHQFANKKTNNAQLRADGASDLLSVQGPESGTQIYKIANTSAGDFWTYTFYIEEEGTYDVDFIACGSNSGNMFNVYFDGELFNNTNKTANSWSYADALENPVKLEGVNLTAGKHTLKFEIAKGTNLWYIDFAKQGGYTAVDNVKAAETVEKAADNNWYTISGQRMAAPVKGGIYIHNGKKILVK